MKVYFISGIAADCRLFRDIALPPGFDRVYLEWITPKESESLSAYAGRLAEKIDNSEPFMLVGLSLGGIMASEIAVQRKPLKTIIIGSVPSNAQLPPHYRFVRRTRLHKLFSGGFFKITAIIKNRLSAIPPADRDLTIDMIRATKASFISWGIDAVLHWQNKTLPNPLVHIHGTRDEVFPFAYTHPTNVISRGGHMLTLTHTAEVNRIIRETLTGYFT